MIKMHFKKIFSVAFILGILLASNVGAQYAGNISDEKAGKKQDVKNKVQEKNTDKLCETILERSENLDKKIIGEENNLKDRQEQRLADWEQKISNIDMKLASSREAWDGNRKQQFEKLKARAETDEQKKAVAAFEETVRTAITTRRTAVDAAMDAFRKGVKDAINARQAETSRLMFDLDSARSAAFQKAKEDCANGVDAKTIRTNLKTAIQAARTKLQTDKQNSARVGEKVVALVRIRQQAVKKALSDFKATMEKARIELKKAFPEG